VEPLVVTREEGALPQVPHSIRPGDVLADRYLLVDLLSESGNGRFWRAHDRTLERHVAVHVVSSHDAHADSLMEAARRSATVPDRRILRVLDVDQRNGLSYVVNEWGSGTSLDILVAADGPVGARRAAWMASEVAACLAVAHDVGVAHGRLVPENVLIDESGSVRVIGFCVDAALLGLPPGRMSSDLTDLGGLLYFLLTGRWPGVSRSEVPAAPQEAGRVLRPRQVKAGVPRTLDTLCDQLLNPFTPGSSEVAHTAAAIAETLRDFVGDGSGMAAAEAAARRRRAAGATQVLPVAGPATAPLHRPRPSDEPEPGPETLDGDTGTPDTTDAPDTTDVPDTTDATDATDTTGASKAPVAPAPASSTELPTQAGMPVFDDENDDVSWLVARTEKPPPPPPFEEQPERPLFAPEPEDGGPARRPRAHSAAASAPEYWPWDASTGTGTGTGSGFIPVTEDDEDDDEVPGRSWLRLAGAVGASALLLLAVVFAFNLGRGRSPLGAEPESDPATASPSASGPALSRVAAVGASDLDPQGDPPDENPELAPLVVDGDPATAWRTMTYEQQFGPGGLKDGVGVTVDLGKRAEVSTVEVTLVGAPTELSVYVTDQAPTDVSGLAPAGAARSGGSRALVELESPASGRYVVVWLTAIPQVEGGFRGEVAEVVVRG
jgi:serine/threonine protein kinase